jgi:CelD/BcsL family acetyltransferase involved in cellulose biosynthesis
VLLKTRPGLGLETIATAPALEDLVPEWSALWTRHPSATPFQAPQWLVPWWKHLGGGQLKVLALRAEGRLRGVAPFFLWGPDAARRTLSLLGAGITDYLDVLVESEAAEEAPSAIADHLAAGGGTWARCDFDQLPADSVLLDLPDHPEWARTVGGAAPCPVLRLAAGWESVPARQRRNIRRSMGHARRQGAVEITRAEPESLDSFLADLFRLHGARWTARGASGVLAGDALAAFHAEAARGLLALGALRLYRLSIGGQAAASVYAFTAKQRAFLYLGGFDPQWEHLSPSGLLIAHAIQEAAQEGVRSVDFLRGQEAYKYFWGAQDSPTYHVQIRG